MIVVETASSSRFSAERPHWGITVGYCQECRDPHMLSRRLRQRLEQHNLVGTPRWHREGSASAVSGKRKVQPKLPRQIVASLRNEPHSSGIPISYTRVHDPSIRVSLNLVADVGICATQAADHYQIRTS